MKTKISIPADLQALLDATPQTEGIVQAIRQDIANLDTDPEDVSDFLKMQFVEDILAAMAMRGISKAELARRLGKSRQYVGSVLNERANFTLDSMAQIACALGMRIGARLYTPDQRMTILPASTRPRPLESKSVTLRKRNVTTRTRPAANKRPSAKRSI